MQRALQVFQDVVKSTTALVAHGVLVEVFEILGFVPQNLVLAGNVVPKSTRPQHFHAVDGATQPDFDDCEKSVAGSPLAASAALLVANTLALTLGVSSSCSHKDLSHMQGPVFSSAESAYVSPWLFEKIAAPLPLGAIFQPSSFFDPPIDLYNKMWPHTVSVLQVVQVLGQKNCLKHLQLGNPAIRWLLSLFQMPEEICAVVETEQRELAFELCQKNPELEQEIWISRKSVCITVPRVFTLDGTALTEILVRLQLD